MIRAQWELWTMLLSYTARLPNRSAKPTYGSLSDRTVSQDGIAKRGIGQSCDHRDLDGSHNLARADTEGSKSQKAIAIGFHQRLQESSCFRKRARPQNGFHWDFE
jgi:hypothetical protein